MNEEAPQRQKTVLHLIDALNVGGAQELLVWLAARTPRTAYRTLVCVLQPDLTIRERIEGHGAAVFALNRTRPSIYRPLSLMLYLYRNVRDVMALCRQQGVDVLHCHLSDAEFIGILAGWLSGVKRVISTVHYPALLPERQSGAWRNRLRVMATRVLYRLADAVVAVSADVADKLQEVFALPRAKIQVIVNGIDVEAIRNRVPKPELLPALGALPTDRLILSVGRLMPPKGHRYLLEALPSLTLRFGTLKLLLAGDGDLRETLASQSRQLGVATAVSFLGSRNDVRDLLPLAEIFILPSLSEGTSFALLEAMAAAKPIVATDIPGNQAVLRHRHNCLLVPPANPEKLSEAIAFLLSHPEEAARYGEQAHRDVYRLFHIDRTVEQLTALWG